MGYNGNTALTWSDDKVEQLKKLWEGGMTAEAIATELGGMTRNAVIGKAHRLNLEKRECKGRPAGPKKPRVRKPAKPKTEPAVRRSNFPAIVTREIERREAPKVKFLGRTVRDYPLGDRWSPFPLPVYGEDGYGFAEIQALKTLYV